MSSRRSSRRREPDTKIESPEPAKIIAPTPPRLLWAIYLVPALLALAIRLFFQSEMLARFPFYATTTPGFDQHTYNVWAQEIAKGDWLGRARGAFYYAPLYPYLLSLAYLIGGVGNIHAGLWLNTCFGVASAVAAAGLGKRFFGPWPGLFAGCVMAMNGSQIAYEGTLLNDSVMTGIALTGLWIYFHLLDTHTKVLSGSVGRLSRADVGSGAPTYPTEQTTGKQLLAWFGLGLLLGLMITGRASNLLPVSALGLWAGFLEARHDRKWIRPKFRKLLPMLFLFIGAFLPPSLCVARNLWLGGSFAMTTNGPILFYLGNAPGSSGVFSYSKEFLAAQEEINKLPGDERNAAWGKRLRDDLKKHPGWLTRILARKTAIFFNSWDAPDNLNVYFFRDQLRIAKFTLGAFPLYVLGFIGLALSWKRWRELFPLYLFSAFLAASLIAVFIVGRYKLPFIGILSIFSGFALHEIVRVTRSREWGSLALACIVALAGSAVFYPRTVEKQAYIGLLRPNEYIANGQALEKANRVAEASRLYDDALSVFPMVPSIRERVAAIRANDSKWSDVFAITQPAFESRALSEGLAQLHLQALLQLGRQDEAARLAAQIAKYFPNNELIRLLSSKDAPRP